MWKSMVYMNCICNIIIDLSEQLVWCLHIPVEQYLVSVNV